MMDRFLRHRPKFVRVSDLSVTTRRCTCPEAADEKRQWCDSQCRPAEDAETVHVSEQMRLVPKLAIDIRYSSRVSVSGGDTALREEAG